MGKQEVLKVHPRGWQDEADEQAMELSAFDHLMPRIWVLIAIVFALPDQYNEPEIIANLKSGLEVTLSQFPALAGTLQTNEKDGSLWVLRKKERAVDLTINWQNGNEDVELPTYAELARRGFPAVMLDGGKLLPQTVTARQLFRGDNDDNDIEISTFQVNFIKGGLILGVGVHHSVSDGPGCDGFLSQWAENTRAVKNKITFPPFNPLNLDRSRLSSKTIPDAAQMLALGKRIPAFRHMKEAPPAPPSDFKMPSFSPIMYKFPKSSCAKLKQDCQPNPSSKAWVSTYDSIMAVLWRSITRSKIPLLNPNLDDKIILMHAVNNRKMLDPPLPERYLGNAVALARVVPTPIHAVIAPENLAKIAASVRESIQSITTQSFQDLADWVSGTENKTWININVNAFLGMDLAGTSWQKMTIYTSQDFGFGLPKAVRFPKPDWEGYVFVYPERPGDDGVEACVLLEDSCHERLLLDEELRRYAHPTDI